MVCESFALEKKSRCGDIIEGPALATFLIPVRLSASTQPSTTNVGFTKPCVCVYARDRVFLPLHNDHCSFILLHHRPFHFEPPHDLSLLRSFRAVARWVVLESRFTWELVDPGAG